jgi:hypothetical protein
MRAIVKARIHFDWTTVAIAVSLVQRYRRSHGSRSVTPHMLHRLLVAFLVIAAKAHQDTSPTNRLVARMVGMNRAELARIEVLACRGLDWSVQVQHDDLVCDEADLCHDGRSVRTDAPFLDRSAQASDEVTSPASNPDRRAAAAAHAVPAHPVPSIAN